MSEKLYLIWSFEHSKWWRANSDGYTTNIDEAGRYGLLTAVRICENGLFADPSQHGEAILPLFGATEQLHALLREAIGLRDREGNWLTVDMRGRIP